MGGRVVRLDDEEPRSMKVPLKTNPLTGGWMFAALPELVDKVTTGFFESDCEKLQEYLGPILQRRSNV